MKEKRNRISYIRWDKKGEVHMVCACVRVCVLKKEREKIVAQCRQGGEQHCSFLHSSSHRPAVLVTGRVVALGGVGHTKRGSEGNNILTLQHMRSAHAQIHGFWWTAIEVSGEVRRWQRAASVKCHCQSCVSPCGWQCHRHPRLLSTHLNLCVWNDDWTQDSQEYFIRWDFQ